MTLEVLNYALQENGDVTQLSTLDQPFDKLVPTFVSLTPIQKTNATRTTTNVYSTSPCPSSSVQSLFSKSIAIPPVDTIQNDLSASAERNKGAYGNFHRWRDFSDKCNARQSDRVFNGLI
jgi:hypothetical protein